MAEIFPRSKIRYWEYTIFACRDETASFDGLNDRDGKRDVPTVFVLFLSCDFYATIITRSTEIRLVIFSKKK